MTKTHKAWKFLDLGDAGKIRSRSGDHTWQIGQWYHLDGRVSPCEYGFHCSPQVREAFSYVPGSVLAEVEVKGQSASDSDDKSVWSDMRIVRAWKFSKDDSVALAIYAAELVLDIFERQVPGDDRPRKAIEAAKAYLANPAAAKAAWAAARAAEAASNAAWAAAKAAEAASDALLAKIEEWFQDRLGGLEEIQA